MSQILYDKTIDVGKQYELYKYPVAILSYSTIDMTNYLWTGQQNCYDQDGNIVSCQNTGQDAEFQTGLIGPEKRFVVYGELVLDNLTGFQWLKDANPGEYPVTWQEALDYISQMNNEKVEGRTDWRLPNRRELRSLMAFETRKPALPEDHPFENVFLNWYWTSTTASINAKYAWSIHMEGARMFFGRKDQYYLFWPVCGQGKGVLSSTGQQKCSDEKGIEIICKGTRQDGDLQIGTTWPKPRFNVDETFVLDKLTGLFWLKNADITSKKLDWAEALYYVKKLALDISENFLRLRLPTINELESLIDCSQHSPALPANHPFVNIRDVYWSSTTSFFDPAWAWALYLNKGATGVGYKKQKGFHLWPVASKV